MNALEEYRAHTTGSDRIYQHPFGVRLTVGAKLAADTLGAWWLLDLIASHQPAIQAEKGALASFQVWRMVPQGDGVKVEAWSDTPDHEESTLLASQFVEFTDFPKREMKTFRLWCVDGTVMIPEEY